MRGFGCEQPLTTGRWLLPAPAKRFTCNVVNSYTVTRYGVLLARSVHGYLANSDNCFVMTTLVTGARGAFGRVLSAWLRDHSREAVVSSSRACEGRDCVACDVTNRIAVR